MISEVIYRVTNRIINCYLDKKEHASAKERKKLRYQSFTIISNNCWGGWVYRFFQLPYLSPTIGLFFLAEDYLKFISDLKGYLNKELLFINPDEANKSEQLKKIVNKFGKYPIARLGDVDIHFLHYSSEDEARKKWEKRTGRIDYSRVIIKFSTQNLLEDQFAEEFDKFDFPNKLFFTFKRFKCKNMKQIFFRRDKRYNITRNEGRYYPLYFNVIKYINSTKDTSLYFADNSGEQIR